MARTQFSTNQFQDDSITQAKIHVSTDVNKSVITKILEGQGILIHSSVDPSNGSITTASGTGNVTLKVDTAFLDSLYKITTSVNQVIVGTGTNTAAGSSGLIFDGTALQIGAVSLSSESAFSPRLVVGSIGNTLVDIVGNTNVNIVLRDLNQATNFKTWELYNALSNFSINRLNDGYSVRTPVVFINGTTNNVMINSTTDNGNKFQVSGDAYFSGNTGIGTAAATYKLRVRGNNAKNGAIENVALFESNDSSGSLGLYIAIGNNATAGSRYLELRAEEAGSAYRPLALNGTGSGNVLIGTTTDPGYKLFVNGISAATSFKIHNSSADYAEIYKAVDVNSKPLIFTNSGDTAGYSGGFIFKAGGASIVGTTNLFRVYSNSSTSGAVYVGNLNDANAQSGVGNTSFGVLNFNTGTAKAYETGILLNAGVNTSNYNISNGKQFGIAINSGGSGTFGAVDGLTTYGVFIGYQSQPLSNGYGSSMILSAKNDGSVLVEILRLQGKDGFVGIGTTNAQAKLDVSGNVKIGTNGYLDLGQYTSNFNNLTINDDAAFILGVNLTFKDAANKNTLVTPKTSTIGGAGMVIGGNSSSINSVGMAEIGFFTTAATAVAGTTYPYIPSMLITKDGNVKIGTTATTHSMLHVNDIIYGRNIGDGDLSGYVFGLEYIYAFHKKLYDQANPIIVLSGDSTTAGTTSDANYSPANLITQIMLQNYIYAGTIYNDGVSGSNTSDWITSYLPASLARNPDLMIIRYGINDGANNRVNFESDLRSGLATIRAARTVAQTAIILMTPNSTNDTPNGRDEAWYLEINPIIRKAARDYQCVFIDTFTFFRDSTSANAWMDNPYGDGRHIHPEYLMNMWIFDTIGKVMFPNNLKRLIGSTNIENPSSGYRIPAVTDAPSTYVRGVSLHRTVGGWPHDGQAITFHQQDGIWFQINNKYAADGFSFRTGGGSGWHNWITPFVNGDAFLGVGSSTPPSWDASVNAYIYSAGPTELAIEGNSYARIYLRDNAEPLDKKVYEILNDSQNFTISRLNDAVSVRTTYLTLFDGGNATIKGALGIGLGTTSPSYMLHAVQSTAALQFSSGGNDNTPTLAILRTASSGDTKLVIGDAAGSYISSNGSGEFKHFAGGGGWYQTFYTSGTEVMRLNISGNLGLGTNNPQTRLHVSGGFAVLRIDDSGGTNASFFGSYGDYTQLSINRNPSTGAVKDTTKASAQFALLGDTTGSQILFYTTATVNVAPTLRMSLNSDGKLQLLAPASSNVVPGWALTNGSSVDLLTAYTTSDGVSHFNSYYNMTFNISNAPNSYGFYFANTKYVEFTNTQNYFKSKVGINTATPSGWLDIVTGVSTGASNDYNGIRLRHQDASSYQLLHMGVSTVGVGGNNNGFGFINTSYIGAGDNTPLLLQTTGGGVGINTTSGIRWPLTVNDTIAVRAPTAAGGNTLGGRFAFGHTAPYIASAFIASVYDKSLWQLGMGMVFATAAAPDVSGVDGIERMRISSDGFVGIGETNPTYLLTVKSANINTGVTAVINPAGTVAYSEGLWTDGSGFARIYNASGTNTVQLSGLTTSSSWILGNLGVGTASPGASTKLQVNGLTLITGGTSNPNDGTSAGLSLTYETTANGTGAYISAIQTGVAWQTLYIQSVPGSNGNTIINSDGGSTVIGDHVTATTNKLEVSNSAAYNPTSINSQVALINRTAGGTSGITFTNTGGTWGVKMWTNPSRGWFEFGTTAGAYIRLWQADYLNASTGIVGWSSETNFATDGVGARDLGLARNAAGILEINNGTPGTLRDLIARNLTISGNVLISSLDTDNTAPTTSGTTKMVITDANGLLSFTSIPSSASGANPTASVGLSAVNGSAASYMRSDATPALDQSIAPVWTGAHTFTSTGSLLVPGIGIKNGAPLLDLWNTSSASSDQKRWGLSVTTSGGVFQLRAYGDDGTTGNSGIAIQIYRNGNAATDIHFLNVSGTSQVVASTTNGLTIAKLATGGTAPTTSGTTKMVITDANGLLSFTTIPSGNNGLSVSSGVAQLGQAIGAGGDPAQLLSDREIPMSTFTLALKGTTGNDTTFGPGTIVANRNASGTMISATNNVTTNLSNTGIGGTTIVTFGSFSSYTSGGNGIFGVRRFQTLDAGVSITTTVSTKQAAVSGTLQFENQTAGTSNVITISGTNPISVFSAKIDLWPIAGAQTKTISGMLAGYSTYFDLRSGINCVVDTYIDFDAGRANGTSGQTNTITNRYGFRVADLSNQLITSTNRWGFYQEGATDKNFFNGIIGIGTSSPTAKLHIAAGSATANTAPLKLTSGTLMTTPEDGAIEYGSGHLYFTISSTRYQLDGAAIGTGTSGRVTYWNGSTTVTSDSNFLYTSSNGGALSVGTTNTQGRLNLGGDKNLSSSGVQSYFATATYTDTTTAASGTASSYIINYIAPPTIAATNASVTFPSITTLEVDAPTAGTNATITDLYAIQTSSSTGHVRVGGNLIVDNASRLTSIYRNVTTINTNTTLTTSVQFVKVDASGGNVTITLPAASSGFHSNTSTGIWYVFYRVDNSGNTVTVQRAGSDTINGNTSFTISGQYTTVNLTCISTTTWAQH
jgi:hypothetical protein